MEKLSRGTKKERTEKLNFSAFSIKGTSFLFHRNKAGFYNEKMSINFIDFLLTKFFKNSTLKIEEYVILMEGVLVWGLVQKVFLKMIKKHLCLIKDQKQLGHFCLC